MTVELNKQEISHMILACETLMEQLRDGQGDRGFARNENDNKDKWYALADILLKLKTTHE